MSDHPPAPVASSPAAHPAAAVDAAALPAGIVHRGAALYLDTALPPEALRAAVGQVFAAGRYFGGLDYAVLMRLLYGTGAALPAGALVPGLTLVRFARAVLALDPARLALYKSLKLDAAPAEAEYCELHVEAASGAAARQAAVAPGGGPDVDEVVAVLWNHGVRFGINVAALRLSFSAGKAERLVVARRQAPVAGRDAAIVEVAQELLRSDAPRLRADGRLDLLNFKNRFPEVKKHQRLLRKVAAVPGVAGCSLAGEALAPAPVRDADLAALAGAGTQVETTRDGDYLVATQAGFLEADLASNRMSVSSTILNRDGVSSRTTGNLKLSRAYEELGDVQELRSVGGADITIHGDVFGKIASRGGEIVLHRNLMGGSAENAEGPIRVAGLASGALLQTRSGEVVLGRAENCVISGTRVRIEHAVNCDIMADEVHIGQAEGCAIAARRIAIDSAAPRKQNEMRLFVMLPDMTGYARQEAALRAQANAFAEDAAALQANIDALTGRLDVRRYLEVAARVRRRELVLTAEQQPQFQKMAQAVAPTLKEISRISLDVKAAQVRGEQRTAQADQVVQQGRGMAAQSSCRVGVIGGELVLRSLRFDPATGAAYALAAKQIKACLHAPEINSETLFAGSSGALDWAFAPDSPQAFPDQ